MEIITKKERVQGRWILVYTSMDGGKTWKLVRVEDHR